MPTEAKPFTKQDLVAFIAKAKKAMETQKLVDYIEFKPLPIKDVKKGTVLRGMIAHSFGPKVVGGYVVLIVLKVVHSKTKVTFEVDQLQTDIYDEEGHPVGQLKARTIQTHTL
jgi:hypothetical protein